MHINTKVQTHFSVVASKFTMRALLLLTVVAVAFASQECGENAHFESCGTACPLTCENYRNPPKICVLRCDIGCQCDEGYVKTADGQCVRPEQCPSSAPIECGENAHFERCGTACPLTCENYQNPPKFCVLSCNIGCHCDKGYVKTADGDCVRPEQCPSSGPIPNEQNCEDEPESGKCLAYFPMYYYDAATQTCRKFVYGGCGGNGNRYISEEDCMQKCQGKAAPAACLQEKKVGLCKAYFPRFYFNKETGKCEKFIYGGCGGNSNNFFSKEDCESVCKE